MSPEAVRLRYFAWLFMVFDLLVSSGYVLFSGVIDFGDAAKLISGLYPHRRLRAELEASRAEMDKLFKLVSDEAVWRGY